MEPLRLRFELLETALGVDVDGILGGFANVELGLELLGRLWGEVSPRSVCDRHGEDGVMLESLAAGLRAEGGGATVVRGRMMTTTKRLTRVRLFWKPLKLMVNRRCVRGKRDMMQKKLLVHAQGGRERSREPPASAWMGEIKSYYGSWALSGAWLAAGDGDDVVCGCAGRRRLGRLPDTVAPTPAPGERPCPGGKDGASSCSRCKRSTDAARLGTIPSVPSRRYWTLQPCYATSGATYQAPMQAIGEHQNGEVNQQS